MIRIIYDYDLEKYKEQYRQIKDFFPPHELYIYESMGKLSESLPYKSVDYNIYLDCISENVYFNMPSKKTILIVNEEYLTHIHHLRRENYKDAELILLEDVVDYYVYLSEYSKEILMKKYPRKSISFNNFIKKIFNRKVEYPIYSYPYHTYNHIRPFILFELDRYSYQNNTAILYTWLKYFSKRKEKLIIKYYYDKELIVKTSKNKKYRNILVYKDIPPRYEEKIGCAILLCSYFSLITKIQEHISKKRTIINLNSGTTDLEKNIYDLLTEYFEKI